MGSPNTFNQGLNLSSLNYFEFPVFQIHQITWCYLANRPPGGIEDPQTVQFSPENESRNWDRAQVQEQQLWRQFNSLRTQRNSTSQTTSYGSLVYSYCSVNTMKWHCSQRKQSATVTDFPKDPVRWARQAFPILQLSKPRFREGLWKFLSAVIWESPICSDLGYFYKVETRQIPRFPRNFFFVCFFIYLPSPSLQSYTKKDLEIRVGHP